MNQNKIGRFIAERRKYKNLTQMQLAEKLCITDRAISKWENGRGLPDASIMLELCEILEINVNELLSGEKIEMEEQNKKSEELLLNLIQEKKNKDKILLRLEILIGFLATLFLLSGVLVASVVDMRVWLKVIIIVGGCIIFIVGCIYAIRIEQIAGLYECQKCHHKYVPSYNKVLFALHIGRSRIMKCPKCGKYNYHKKTIE